jgi:hypothetical protein
LRFSVCDGSASRAGALWHGQTGEQNAFADGPSAEMMAEPADGFGRGAGVPPRVGDPSGGQPVGLMQFVHRGTRGGRRSLP